MQNTDRRPQSAPDHRLNEKPTIDHRLGHRPPTKILKVQKCDNQQFTYFQQSW